MNFILPVLGLLPLSLSPLRHRFLSRHDSPQLPRLFCFLSIFNLSFVRNLIESNKSEKKETNKRNSHFERQNKKIQCEARQKSRNIRISKFLPLFLVSSRDHFFSRHYSSRLLLLSVLSSKVSPIW